jgi:hypothetical protein
MQKISVWDYLFCSFFWGGHFQANPASGAELEFVSGSPFSSKIFTNGVLQPPILGKTVFVWVGF